MQEYEVNVEVYPENSIDSDYIMTSSDYNIANIIGNKVVAKNTGTATIEVVNVTRRKNSVYCKGTEIKSYKKVIWKVMLLITV